MAFCQEKQCRELPDHEFEMNRRVTIPARITDYDGREITVKRSFSSVIKFTKFPVDSETLFPVGFEQNYRDMLFTIVFCADTNTVISVQKFSAMKNGYESKEKQETRLAEKRKKKQ
jgi:hypothetical protein